MPSLKTLREFSAMITGDVLNEMPRAKTEWINTGELKFFEEIVSAANFFKGQRTANILKQKWIEVHKGDILQIQWREVPVEHLYENYYL